MNWIKKLKPNDYVFDVIYNRWLKIERIIKDDDYPLECTSIDILAHYNYNGCKKGDIMVVKKVMLHKIKEFLKCHDFIFKRRKSGR